MTKEEKKQWNELYDYVKKEILMYDDNQNLPKNIVLKLKGLSEGKAMANKKTKATANYGYDIVLYTFKANKINILNVLKSKTFENEFFKFNYICAIISNNINDIYLRIQNAKKSKEKIEVLNVDNLTNEGAEYQQKSNKTNNKLNDLW